jgi:hypothetical protein
MAEVELPKPDELHEHAANSFSRRVALVTAIYAVVLAIAALGGNQAMKEMLLAQQQSSDQWAFYQAKVIREHLYRAQKLRLEADLTDRAPAAAREKHEALLKKLEKDAKKLETMRDGFQARGPYFLVAVIFSFSLVLAVMGTVLTANGYFMVLHLPFFTAGP